jgi:hypothetical protein
LIAATVAGIWLLVSIIAAGVWAWWNRNKNQPPDQWRRYRGIADLRERNDVVDSALLAQQLRSGVLESSAGVFLFWPPIQCTACKRMAAIVRRGDNGALCSACR